MLTWLQICWRAMLFVPSSICLGIFPVIIACWIGLCVVLCGVLCLVAIIQSISSGLLNPLFFDYNFFCKPQNIVPTDNTANYWSVLSVQSRRSIKCCDWQAPPRATPDQPSPCVAVPSCAILSRTNTNAYTKTNTTPRPECFCFCYGSSTYGMIAYGMIRDHGSASKSFVSSCLLSKEKELSRALKHQTQNQLHLDYLRTYLVTMRILFLLIIRRCTKYRHFSFQSQSPIDCRIDCLFCITLKEQNIFDPPLFCNVLGQSCWEHQSQVGLDVGPPSPCVLFHSCQIVSSKGLTLRMQVIIFDVDVRFKLARALACV